jgi:hypothetical protein
MGLGPEELVELKSSKIQLEVGLIYLKRKRAEMEKQKALLVTGPRTTEATSRLAQLQADLTAVAREISARETTVQRISEAIDRTERQAQEESLEQMLRANEGMAAELASLRAEMLRALRALAEPLRRYQEIADRKTRLVRRIGTAASRDLSYPNYLECALLRQDESDDALRYVIETLKRLRVVA